MIDEALPQEKEYYLSDHQIKGLCCRILPSGVKTYNFRYTCSVDHKRKKFRIGSTSELSLEFARKIALEHKFDVHNYVDPKIKFDLQIHENITNFNKIKVESKKYEDLAKSLEKFNNEYIKFRQNISELNIKI